MTQDSCCQNTDVDRCAWSRRHMDRHRSIHHAAKTKRSCQQPGPRNMCSRHTAAWKESMKWQKMCLMCMHRNRIWCVWTCLVAYVSSDVPMVRGQTIAFSYWNQTHSREENCHVLSLQQNASWIAQSGCLYMHECSRMMMTATFLTRIQWVAKSLQRCRLLLAFNQSNHIFAMECLFFPALQMYLLRLCQKSLFHFSFTSCISVAAYVNSFWQWKMYSFCWISFPVSCCNYSWQVSLPEWLRGWT